MKEVVRLTRSGVLGLAVLLALSLGGVDAASPSRPTPSPQPTPTPTPVAPVPTPEPTPEPAPAEPTPQPQPDSWTAGEIWDIYALIDAGKAEDAITALKARNAAAANKNADTLNLLGYAHRKLEPPMYAESEEFYLQALAVDPDHHPSLEYLAELYLFTDRKAEADEQRAKLEALCPGDSREDDCYALLQLELAYDQYNAGGAVASKTTLATASADAEEDEAAGATSSESSASASSASGADAPAKDSLDPVANQEQQGEEEFDLDSAASYQDVLVALATVLVAAALW